MTELIRRWAEEAEGVRAAILTGSMARGGAVVDALTDHDVALFLDDPDALEASGAWYDAFGDVLVTIPETREELGREFSTRLVVYDDGSRIDFSLFPTDILRVIAILPELPPWLDAGYQVLYDPERITGTMVPPFGRGYTGRAPSPDDVLADIEELFWEALVVAKELVRGHSFAAAYSAESVIRHGLLRRMLEWKAGAASGWARAAGPVGRGLEGMLSPELLERARPGVGAWIGDEAWEELTELLTVFTDVARDVSAHVGLEYPEDQEQAVRARLAEMRRLAKG